MGYYANGSGSATIIKGQKKAITAALENKYDKRGVYCGLDYDIDEIDGVCYINIYDSEKYHEDETNEFLSVIAPYISEGRLDYSGEDDCIWRFIFNPDTKEWKEENATIDYHFESYSDEELIKELEKRGYSVATVKKIDR